MEPVTIAAIVGSLIVPFLVFLFLVFCCPRSRPRRFRVDNRLRRPVATLHSRLRPGDRVVISEKRGRGKRSEHDVRPTTFRRWEGEGGGRQGRELAVLATAAGQEFRREVGDILEAHGAHGRPQQGAS